MRNGVKRAPIGTKGLDGDVGAFRIWGFVMTDAIAVELHPHSPQWTRMAQSETEKLQGTLGDILIIVHHIGSTSVPGMLAKPIVDLLPVVDDAERLDAAMPQVLALGYECLGEFGLPGRRYCRKNDPVTGKRVFQLHCYGQGSPEILRHVAFAAYLRAHPLIAKDYEAEKIRAAALHPDNTLDYNAAKNDWIKWTEAVALRWWEQRQA